MVRSTLRYLLSNTLGKLLTTLRGRFCTLNIATHMNLSEYIPLATRTCKELPPHEHLVHMALGLAGEMGELIDALKRHHIYGKELDQVNIVEEVGDLAWYMANLMAVQPKAKTAYEASLTVAPVDPGKLKTAQATLTAHILKMNELLSQTCSALIEPDSSDEGQVDCICAIAVVIFVTAQLADVDLEDAYDRNIEKLAHRYGDKYDDYSALHRDTDGERLILEGASE